MMREQRAERSSPRAGLRLQAMQTIDDTRWHAIETRDRAHGFFFGVRTTGVYCRSGCPARTPARRNVVPFGSAGDARAAGFRPCKRCAPDDVSADAATVRVIERAAEMLASDEPPSLAAAADAVGLSRFHFQRLFRRVTGVTPGEYVRARRRERLRALLRGGDDVTAAIHGAGYGSTSRVYGEPVLGMTPSSVRAGGRGERLAYATADCTFGRVLVARSERGICAIELGADDDAVCAAFARDFPHAERVRDAAVGAALARVLALVDDPHAPVELTLDVRGTAFQHRVWNALRAIRPGTSVTYAALARAIGAPRAIRAVGAACAANRLAIAVPCHRVVRDDGDLAGYRWGLERKRALLEHERRA